MKTVNSNFTDSEKKFSQRELKLIEDRASIMFERNEVRSYFNVGSHDVCLERDSSSDKTISVFKMDITLEQNEEFVTRFNKRKR